MKKLIYTIAFTLAGLVGMAQTNQPLPSGAVPFGATTYLSPLDSTIWLYKERDGTAIKVANWVDVDSLFAHGVYDVEGIPELEAFNGKQTAVVVRDTLRGGLFIWQSSGSADGGTVFPATGKGSGYWHRVFSPSDGLNVLWYGADPTGAVDQSALFADVLLSKSVKTGRVVIPKGVYRVDEMIGTIDMPGDIGVTWDLAIEGTGMPTLICQSADNIQAIFGFTIREGANLRISGIHFNANKKSSRGIYLKAPTNTNGTSDIDVVGNRIENCYTWDEDLFTSAGIYVGGNISRLNISSNDIRKVSIAPGILDLGNTGITGIVTGISSGFSPRYTNVTDNFIDGVTSEDEEYTADQTGIFTVGGGGIDSLSYRVVIRNNTVKNTRSRFIKAQVRNTYVENNTCVIDSIVIPPPATTQTGIDIQYSDGYVINNVLDYKDYSHQRAIALTQRDTSRANTVVSGNKIKFTRTSANTAILYHTQSGTPRTGNISISDNTVIGPVNFFTQIGLAGSGNYASLFNNYANSIAVSFLQLYGETGASANLSLIANKKDGASVPVVAINNSTVPIWSGGGNIGITDAPQYVGSYGNQTDIGGDKGWAGRQYWKPAGTGIPSMTATSMDMYSASANEMLLRGVNSLGSAAFYLRTYGSSGTQLTLNEGGVEVTKAGDGVTLKSPNGTRWRITVDNSGNLTTTSL